jgi:hypothetical protein
MLAIKKAQRSAGTLHMYGVKLGHAARIFGAESPMASITAGAIDRFISTRTEEGAGNNTIARELTCIRQMLRYAKRAGEYSEDISNVMPIGFAAEYVPVTRTLAREHVATLFAALRTDDERAWCALALTFAADAADIHRMRPEDYDRTRGLFHVRGTKNRVRDAWLPVLPMFQELFDYALPRLPIHWARNHKGIGEACARAGLPHLSPKDLRRTAITWLAEGGVEQSIASRFARHMGDQMVRKIYAQIAPRALGSLINAQFGTDPSQTIARPLGGMADAGDLKGLPDDPRSRQTAESPAKATDSSGADEPLEPPIGTPDGTESSQRWRRSPGWFGRKGRVAA